ncbi:MAG: 30S ribosome-binding factor RbfA [Phycisphaerales bacterium]|jgi:ribosome-binding factor A|nr:30S ribosome-binding factor RbfA [Phycisphaerales bacterium]
MSRDREKTNHRTEQFAAELRELIQEIILRGLNDPRISGLITVTGVRVTPDAKEAHVKVSVLPEERQDLTYHGLKAASKHIRHLLSDTIRHRQIPMIVFKLDETLKREAEVNRALAQVALEREAKAAAGANPEPLAPEPPDSTHNGEPSA